MEQQTLAICQPHERLGMPFSGYRPQTRTGTTRENDWNQHGNDLSMGRKELILPQRSNQAHTDFSNTPFLADVQDCNQLNNVSSQGFPCMSFPDNLGAAVNGHRMPILGSSQAMQRSCSGA